MTEGIGIAEFRAFRDQLRDGCGLYFADDKHARVAKVVAGRMSDLGLASFADYQRLLSSASLRAPELARLGTLLTVGETYFFRNKDQWRAFADCVVPWIVERSAAHGTRRIRVWSAGCSTGEEAFTAAIVLRQTLPEWSKWHVEIIGTDLNPSAIARAEAGVYTQHSFRGVTPEIRDEFFRVVDSGHYRPRGDLCPTVRFTEMNLLDAAATAQIRDVDVVFCRNVLIYFDAAGRDRVIGHVRRSLRPDGYLFLGHAEVLRGFAEDFATVHVRDTFLHKAVPAGVRRPRVRRSLPAPAITPPSAALPKPEPEPEPVSLVDLREEAMRHLCVEAKSEARRVFVEILRREPNDVDALVGMALVLAGSGDGETALSYADRARRGHPMSAEAHCVTAQIHEANGAEDAARAELEKAVYLDAGFAIAHFMLAGIHARSDRAEAARREFAATLDAVVDDDPRRVLLFSGGFGKEVLARICQQRLGLRNEGQAE